MKRKTEVEKSVKQLILELPKPITVSPPRLANRFDVSRQYIYQVLESNRIPYVSHKVKRQKCKNLSCPNLAPSYNPRRTYCDMCLHKRYDFQKTGRYIKCGLEDCSILVYRNAGTLKRMKGDLVFCSHDHYIIWRVSQNGRRRNRHTAAVALGS